MQIKRLTILLNLLVILSLLLPSLPAQAQRDWATIANPSLYASYAYDEFDAAYSEAAGQYGRGYRTGMVDPSGSTSWTYDPRGRVIDEIKTVSGVGFFHSAWSYNSADLLASQVFPANAGGVTGEILTYSYHPQAALKSVYSDLGYYYVQNMTYDAAGRVDVRKLGAANLEDNPTLLIDADYFPWDASGGQGRLQRLKSGSYDTPTSLQDFTYSYDLLGNVLSIANARAGGTQTQSFTYDALQHLTSSAASGGTEGGILWKAIPTTPRPATCPGRAG